MATREWDGSNGSFKSRSHWRPKGVPHSGDTAIVSRGYVTADHANLEGIAIQLTSAGVARTKLSLHDVSFDNIALGSPDPGNSTADIIVRGLVVNDGNVTLGGGYGGYYGSTLNIQIVGHGIFENQGQVSEGVGSDLNITGARGAKLLNNGSFFIAGSSASIGVDVTGRGEFDVSTGHALSAGDLTFIRAVGSDQVVNLSGQASLKLANASKFLGQISFDQDGPESVTLLGVTSTSSKYDNGTLDVFNGKALVAALKMTSADAMGFSLYNQGGNTVITPDAPVQPNTTSMAGLTTAMAPAGGLLSLLTSG